MQLGPVQMKLNLLKCNLDLFKLNQIYFNVNIVNRTIYNAFKFTGIFLKCKEFKNGIKSNKAY